MEALQVQDWQLILSSLEALTQSDKANARLILEQMPVTMAAGHLVGTPDAAAERIKGLLQERAVKEAGSGSSGGGGGGAGLATAAAELPGAQPALAPAILHAIQAALGPSLFRGGTRSYEQLLDSVDLNTAPVEALLNLRCFSPEGIPAAIATPPPDMTEASAMLPVFLAICEGLFERDGGASDVEVLDTRGSRYLDGLAPHVTLVPKGYTASAFSAAALVELQAPPISKGHRGKAVQHLISLLSANPARSFAWCMVTDLRCLELYKANRSNGMLVFERTSPVALNSGVGWQAFQAFCLSGLAHLGWHAPRLKALGSPLLATAILGRGRDVLVYCATSGNRPVACKVYAHGHTARYTRERDVLRRINDLRTGTSTSTQMHTAGPAAAGLSVLPELIDSDDAGLVLVTSPVVKPLEEMTCNLLAQLFDGLQALHCEVKCVHWDIEPKHLGVAGPEDTGGAGGTGDRAALYDLDTAAPLDVPPGTGYRGTLLYAADEVLDELDKGWGSCTAGVVPRPRHDMASLVKSVYMLLHPDALAAAQHLTDPPGDVRRRLAEVRAFWEAEFSERTVAGRAWRGLLESAGRIPGADYDVTAKELQKGLSSFLRGVK